MAQQSGMAERTFKTAWFSKAARKAHISDDELCSAIRQVMLGQTDDLGGGVFKKRLNRNEHRSIILAMAGERWVFAFLFAKKDQSNIDEGELREFRTTAKLYGGLSKERINQLLQKGKWEEICHDQKT